MVSPVANPRTFLTAGGHQLHYRWLGNNRTMAPLIFLHEGLGSVELWREFPARIVARTGRRGLLYSRYGNGWSDPLLEPRKAAYMHDEAAVLAEIAGSWPQPPVLVGHSDGASIALIYASDHPVAGLVLIAPHVLVEPEAVASIDALRREFPNSEMASRMAKYHADPTLTFWGWNDIWLDASFRDWNLESLLPDIDAPVFLVQGDNDEFGTIGQVDAVTGAVRGPVKRLVVAGAGHAPHLSHPGVVEPAVARFVLELP